MKTDSLASWTGKQDVSDSGQHRQYHGLSSKSQHVAHRYVPAEAPDISRIPTSSLADSWGMGLLQNPVVQDGLKKGRVDTDKHLNAYVPGELMYPSASAETSAAAKPMNNAGKYPQDIQFPSSSHKDVIRITGKTRHKISDQLLITKSCPSGSKYGNKKPIKHKIDDTMDVIIISDDDDDDDNGKFNDVNEVLSHSPQGVNNHTSISYKNQNIKLPRRHANSSLIKTSEPRSVHTVHELFTPPRSPSIQIMEVSPALRRTRKRITFSCVLIPPLPDGHSKSDYRPFLSSTPEIRRHGSVLHYSDLQTALQASLRHNAFISLPVAEEPPKNKAALALGLTEMQQGQNEKQIQKRRVQELDGGPYDSRKRQRTEGPELEGSRTSSSGILAIKQNTPQHEDFNFGDGLFQLFMFGPPEANPQILDLNTRFIRNKLLESFNKDSTSVNSMHSIVKGSRIEPRDEVNLPSWAHKGNGLLQEDIDNEDNVTINEATDDGWDSGSCAATPEIPESLQHSGAHNKVTIAELKEGKKRSSSSLLQEDGVIDTPHVANNQSLVCDLPETPNSNTEVVPQPPENVEAPKLSLKALGKRKDIHTTTEVTPSPLNNIVPWPTLLDSQTNFEHTPKTDIAQYLQLAATDSSPTRQNIDTNPYDSIPNLASNVYHVPTNIYDNFNVQTKDPSLDIFLTDSSATIFNEGISPEAGIPTNLFDEEHTNLWAGPLIGDIEPDTLYDTIDPTMLGGNEDILIGEEYNVSPAPPSPHESIISQGYHSGSSESLDSSASTSSSMALMSPTRTTAVGDRSAEISGRQHSRPKKLRFTSDMVPVEDEDNSGSEWTSNSDKGSRPTKITIKKPLQYRNVSPREATPASANEQSETSKPRSARKISRRTDWPCGKERHFCHHCRTGSYRLKMLCHQCPKRYCVRCVAVRYPEILFNASLRDFLCPACKNKCKCDLCCRRRGEVYISSRPKQKETANDKQQSTSQYSTRQTHPRQNDSSQTSSTTPPGPTPQPIASIEPAKYWGAVYDITGKKVALAYIGVDGREDTVIALPAMGPPPITPKKKKQKMFVGALRTSWGCGPHDVIEEVESEIGRSKTKKRKQNKSNLQRVFIGDPALLYMPVLPNQKAKATIHDVDPWMDVFGGSSLSSLSDSNESEVRISDVDDVKEFSPNMLDDSDVARAIALALGALQA